MTDDQHDDPHDDDPHDDDQQGHDDAHDDHAHDEEPLGPVDVTAWGAGIAGVLLGLAVALAFRMATLPTTPPA